MPRLFFALNPAPGQRALLVARAAPLVARLQAQPVSADNLHVTLCFVGAVEEERVGALRAVAAGVRGERATLSFDAFDYWDSSKILCATAPENGDAPVAGFARRLGEALLAAGFTPDIKPFRAHFTLGRKVRAELAAGIAWPAAWPENFVLRADRFALMDSRRNDAGSVYSVVESWPLYGTET
jgi:2'-5' RNA ligase